MCIQVCKGEYKSDIKRTGGDGSRVKAFVVKATGPEFKSPASKLKVNIDPPPLPVPVTPDLGGEARRSPGFTGQPV